MKTLVRSLRLALMGLLFAHSSQAEELQAGMPAPDFSLRDQASKQHSLKDFRGQWLVLYFYPKDDTPGCTTEACNFRDDYYRLKELGTAVVGVSLDDSESHEEFAEKYSLPFPLLADMEGRVAKAYGSLWKLGPIRFASRHSFIIDPEGIIQKVYRDVDADTHSKQVIADLEKLQKSSTSKHE